MLTPVGKIDLLRATATAHGLRTIVETGIYSGHGSSMEMLDLCPTVYLLDYDKDNCAAAMRACPTATVVCGDSKWTLPTVCRKLTEPTLFWLDAHLIEEDGPLTHLYPCPLIDELEAIWELAPIGSVILIDDLRMMGENGWPTIERLRQAAGVWEHRDEIDDVMRLSGRLP